MSFPSGTSRTSLIRKFGRNSDQARDPNKYREELQRQASLSDRAEMAVAQNLEAKFAPQGSIAAQNDPFKYGSVFRAQNQGLAGAFDAAQSEAEMKRREQAKDDNYEREMRRRSLLRPMR